MKIRFRMYRRRNGVFYCEDGATGKQESLGTKTRNEAERLIHAKNEAHIQPSVNLQIARAYLLQAALLRSIGIVAQTSSLT
ncbi:MAG: hypothetical protein NT105_23460 [Verrucomicrobia bacterium]|nr:hypothetical protein [Verrucomicrobiota bacterium]